MYVYIYKFIHNYTYIKWTKVFFVRYLYINDLNLFRRTIYCIFLLNNCFTFLTIFSRRLNGLVDSELNFGTFLVWYFLKIPRYFSILVTIGNTKRNEEIFGLVYAKHSVFSNVFTCPISSMKWRLFSID